MAVFEPTVPRWIYEQKCKEYDALFAAYAALRPLQSPVNAMKVLAPKLDSATETLDALDQTSRDPRIEAAVKKLLEEKPDLSPAAALREAKKMLAIATGKADAPAVMTTIGAALR